MRAPPGRGDDVYTPIGQSKKPPSWSTVRRRFWKNEGADPKRGSYTAAELGRMRTGRAPQRYNAKKGGMESMDLSHEPTPARDGGRAFVPRWPQEHAAVDGFRRPGY
jgi:filamentous hemagglutinin